jgi:hypothetical protein
MLFPNGTVLTVDRVEIRTKQGRSNQNQPKADPEDGEKYGVVYFRELSKPIGLNKGNAMCIAGIAGSEFIEDWKGAEVLALPWAYEDTDDRGQRYVKWVWRLYPNSKRLAVTLSPKSDLQRLCAMQERAKLQAKPASPSEPGSAAEKIGFERAVKMMGLLRERNLSWSDVVEHAKQNQTLHHVDGVLPPNLTEQGARVVGSLIKHMPKVTDVDTDKLAVELRAQWYPPTRPVAGEVIDPKTGEVLNPPVTEDDIPF